MFVDVRNCKVVLPGLRHYRRCVNQKEVMKAQTAIRFKTGRFKIARSGLELLGLNETKDSH